MKQRFWLFKRAGVYYVQDAITRKKESLKTRDKREAECLRAARNEATNQPLVGLAIGKAYLAVYYPQLIRRIWSHVMEEFCARGKEATRR